MGVRPTAAAALAAAFLLTALGAATLAQAEDGGFVITIKEHRFDPETLEIPAGQKVKLVIRNQDPTPEEFESYSLNREKIISGSSEGLVYVGPLDPGTYDYFGDFHADTAQGKLIAK